MAAAGLLLVPWWTPSQLPGLSLHCTAICTAGISLTGLGIKLVSPKCLFVPAEFTPLNEDASQFLCFSNG